MNSSEFALVFRQITGHSAPRDWQTRLADSPRCHDRLIRVPTGMGKTEGVIGAWLWHRLERNDATWPRRLVWCLPMRVLVEQTIDVGRRMLALWRESTNARQSMSTVGVYPLMGGTDVGDWHLAPDQPAILVGTQDMLLSRALNRGFACGRARWPIEYALLNHDSLWVMDEVQLMDVGLATSVQLQAFRNQEADHCFRPCHTWWMSATLQPDWLDTVDFHDQLTVLRKGTLHIPAEERRGDVWKITKPLEVCEIPARIDTADKRKSKDSHAESLQRWVEIVLSAHRNAQPANSGRVTLVIVNRVDTATELHNALSRALSQTADAPQLELIHSRFRGLERAQWRAQCLSRKHCEDAATNLIIVATQVVEAGVDISASALITELAPWPSLVQRFGRAARYRGTASVVVVDRKLSEKDALPYDESDLAASRKALDELTDVGLASLELFEESLRTESPELLGSLYRYDYVHLLTRRECDELFDTSPDLTGADLDISRFIRSGDERDVHVCWVPAEWDDSARKPPPPDWQPVRDGLCPVPAYAARKWLLQGNRLKDGCRAWSWDYLDGAWRQLSADRCFPGQTILVESNWGGYDLALGFTGERPKKNDAPLLTEGGFRRARTTDPSGLADLAQSREDLSIAGWETIATHGQAVGKEASRLAAVFELSPEIFTVFDFAGRLHDWGKAHPAFQFNIRKVDGHPGRDDLAKAPDAAWISPRAATYCLPEENRPCNQRYGRRRGFRHELATTLAVFELLARFRRDHEALLGPHRELIEQQIIVPPQEQLLSSEESISAELASLDGGQFNLLAYLLNSHHGKVRGSLQASPHDQDFPAEDEQLVGEGQPLRGVRDGDGLPEIDVYAHDGKLVRLPAVSLHLDVAALGLSARYGASWGERVHSLLAVHGPFALAFLETLLRVADQCASRMNSEDSLLNGEKPQ